jgi:hypothetical protein
MRLVQALLLLALLVSLADVTPAATLWSGPPVEFVKRDWADWTLPENQDRLSDGVALTRGDLAGLFNAAAESGYQRNISPAGTRWAFSGINGNPVAGFGAANHAQLLFQPWETAVGGAPILPGNILNRPAVVHLVEEDVYLDLTFTAWKQGISPGQPTPSGGGFAYTRSSPAGVVASAEPRQVPLLPPAAGLGLAAVLALLGWRRLRVAR